MTNSTPQQLSAARDSGRAVRGVLVIVLLSLLCGCSNDAPKLFTATGQVTFNDKPLAHAGVVFGPADRSSSARLAIGRTDKTGAFTLYTDTRSGAAPGNYIVTVMATEQNQPASPSLENMMKLSSEKGFQPPKLLIPERYTKPKESGLSFAVSATQKNHFDIKLTGNAP